MTTANPQHDIVVGVDGSPYSEATLRWAVREAVMRNKRLSIVNVISPLIGGWSGVGSRGRGGFAGMLVGSVSSAVVHGTHTPVIVARHD